MFSPLFRFFIIAFSIAVISGCTGGGGSPATPANVATGTANLPTPGPTESSSNPGGAYILENLRGNWMAKYANSTGPNSNSGTTWKDLSGNGFNGTLNDTTHGFWTGSGTSSSPYSLFLDGNSHVDFGTSVLTNHSKMVFTGWINPAAASQPDKVLFGNSGGGSGNGFTVRQSRTQPGKIEFVIGGQSYENSVLSDQPVAYWRLGETSGNTANDSSGNGHNGTYIGSPALGQGGSLSGDSDAAAAFNGSSSYVNVGSVSALQFANNEPFSIEFWTKPDASKSQLVSIVTYAISANSYGYYCSFDTTGTVVTDGVFCDYWSGPGGNFHRISSPNGIVSKGAWHHIVYTSDGSNTLAGRHIYVDGFDSTAMRYANGTPGSIDYSGAQFQIANRTSSYYAGSMDEVAVYNKALTPTQVGNHYNISTNSYGSKCISSSTLSNLTWSFIGGRFDGDEISLYVNGKQECSIASMPDGLSSPSTNFTVGSTASSTKGWSGSISDLKIYGVNEGSEINTADDIKTNFDVSADTYRLNPVGKIVTDGLVLNLDAANATTVAPYPTGCATGALTWSDLSTSSLVGSLTSFSGCNALSGWNGDGGQTVNGTAGPYRLSFDGTDDYVNTSLDPSMLGQTFTISAWVYPTAAGNYRGIAGGHVDAHQGFVFGQWNTGYWQFGYGDGSNWPTGVATVLTPNAWTYVTAVYKGSDYVKLYLNGTLTRTQPQSTDIVHTTNFWVGRAYNAAGRYFQGGIGEFAVYNRILTAAEITQNCTALKARFGGAVCN